MASLAEFRKQYPQYDAMPDGQLADALYRKFYSTMPRADYDAKLGLAGQGQQQAGADQPAGAGQSRAALGLPDSAARGTVVQGRDGNQYQYVQTSGDVGGNGAWGWMQLGGSGDDQPVTDASDPAQTSANPQQFVGDGPKQTGLLENIGAGIDHGANTLLGAPVDLPVWVGNQLINGGNAALNLAGQGKPIPNIPTDLPGSSEKWEQTQERLGFTPPSDVVPADAGQRLARSASEAVTIAAVPEAAAIRLGQAAGKLPAALQAIPEAVGSLFGQSSTAGQFARNMTTNAAAGVGAEVGMDGVPDELKPITGIVGGLAAATLAHGATGLPGLASAGRNVAGEYLAPLSKGGRERLAGNTLRDEATDPKALREALDAPVEELVPGVKPTTFQLTGDMGVGALERGVAARNPAEFMQRRADQNAAQISAIKGVQPTGAPEAVSNALRDRLEQIDTQTYERVQAATDKARAQADAAGQGSRPEVVGENIRASLESARGAAKEQEAALWAAVDPDGSLALSPAQTQTAAKQIVSDTPASARQPSGEESSIYGVVAQYGDTVPLRELSALHSRIKDELRALRTNGLGESASYRRLTQLNNSVFGDLNEAVVAKVVQENEAVAAGVMAEADTIAAKLRGEAEAFFGARQAATGEVGGIGVGGYSPSRSSSFSGIRGTKVPQGRGFADGSRDPRLSGNGLEPNFDEDALGRLTEAREATQARVNTFDNRVLAPIRQRPSTQSPYNMQPASVPGRIFHTGPKSFDDIRAYRAAVGDKQALRQLQSYAVDRLRVDALRDDGTFDPRKLAVWRRNHADALRAFPQLDAKFENAATASEAMADAVVSRKLALDDAQKGALGRIMGVDDPEDVVRTIGAVFTRQDRNNQMMLLRRAIGSDKQAAEGLRKAVVDYMTRRFVGNTEAGTSGLGTIKSDGFQNFVKENKGALRIAGFSDTEMDAMERLAQSLQQTNRSLASVKFPGGSNTAQDVLAANIGDSQETILSKALAASASATPAVGATVVGGPFAGFAALLGTNVLQAMRQAGLARVDDLIKDAIMSPDRAKYLLLKATPANVRMSSTMLGQMYRRAVAASFAAQGDEGSKQPIEATVRGGINAGR